MKIYRPNIDDPSETYDRILTPDGTELVAVDDTSPTGCTGCVFQSHQKFAGMYCSDTPFCNDNSRDDNRTIIWVKQ